MSDVTIKYNGTSITTMDTSGTKTLTTAGKYCAANVAVEYTDPEKPTQTKSATPSLSSQNITPDSGYGLSSVGVSAVTKELLATLDADFAAENIKTGVDILGLVGTLAGGGSATIQGRLFAEGSFTLGSDATTDYQVMTATALYDAVKADFPGSTSLSNSVYRTSGLGYWFIGYYLGGILWMDNDSAITHATFQYPDQILAIYKPASITNNSACVMQYLDIYGSVAGRSQASLVIDYTGITVKFTTSYKGYAGAKYNFLIYINNHGGVV